MNKGNCIHVTAPPKAIFRPFATLIRLGICSFILILPTSVLHAQNAIQIENAKQGTSSWAATNLADNSTGYTNVIEGYASLASVNRGGQITFYVNVSTPGDSFTMNIYRMGWYGGLGARAVLSVGPLPGVQQPIPTPDPTTGLIECNWTPSYVLNLTSDTDPVSNWVSGVYTVLLTDTTSGLQRYMVFVVRDDARPSNYFFDCAVNTYQAYNNWGGKSLYAFDSQGSNPSTKVSFNRPYQSSYGYDGSGDFITGWEYDMVRFLEREGYDITYGTDIDVHENASLLLSHKAVLIIGHNEYWSMAMRNNIIAARDGGKNLGFFSGDNCYWQVRFEPSTVNSAPDRTMVGYKDFSKLKRAPGPDPYYTACNKGNTADCSLVTVRWRDTPVSMPENAFVGIMWANDPVDGDILVTNTSNWVFNTTGLQNNQTLPGLLGYEVDSLFSNGLTPSGTVTLAASPYTTTGSPPTSGTANTTVYAAASGATVFAAGTFQFSWGLDNYSRVLAGENSLVSFGAQQMTRNLLAKFIGDQPPAASVGGPYTGATLQPIQFNGTGSSDPDGFVTTYEWDYGDGSAGTGSLPTHSFSHSGTYTVSLIVTDDEGSRNAATTTATITDQPIALLSTNSLSFGNQQLGTSSAPQQVTLSNTGAAALAISSILASGDYSQTNNCPASLGTGNECLINVTFKPMTPGARPGAITITDNNNSIAGSTQTVALSGTGAGTAPVAAVSPPALNFGIQLLGVSSPAQAITISNSGNAPLIFSSFTPSGDFAVTGTGTTCSTISPLAGNASCTIALTFTPSASGPRRSSISISDNAAGSPQAVILTGVGTLASLSPSSLNFTGQIVGIASTPQVITLTNVGSIPMNIWQIGFLGANASDFSISTNTCASKLSGGANCMISVTFTPGATGTRTASLLVSDDGGGNPQAAGLSGTGMAADPSDPSAVSMSFGRSEE